MEWVETTAKTVEEAKDLALDQLGVAEDDAEFEVVEEPRAGLFGRVRGSARVRARVRPTQPRPKLDRRDRRRRADATKPARPGANGDDPAAATDHAGGEAVEGDGEAAGGGERSSRSRRGSGRRAAGAAGSETAKPGAAVATVDGDDAPASKAPTAGRRTSAKRTQGSNGASAREEHQVSEQIEAGQVGDEAVRFVDGLLAAFGLSGTTELVVDGDELELRVAGDNLGLLVGPRGTTLQAVQDLTRVAAQRRLGDRDTRLRVDVGGYRERRREALTRFAHQVAADVVSSGQARALEPMSSADRKVIHDVLTTVDGVITHSEGDDPNRRVIIAPANA